MNERQNRFRGCLVAGAAGDALGYPIEFQRCIRERQQTEYPGKGLISDDTQMTIFTAEGLLWWTKQKDSQPELTQEQAIRRAYMDWYYTQTKTPLADPITSLRDLPELNNFRAPGVTCLSAMSSKKNCTIQSPCNDSKGCGGIMRVAPCGLFAPDMAAACRLGAQAAALTHGHPLGYLSAGIFAAMSWTSIPAMTTRSSRSFPSEAKGSSQCFPMLRRKQRTISASCISTGRSRKALRCRSN